MPIEAVAGLCAVEQSSKAREARMISIKRYLDSAFEVEGEDGSREGDLATAAIAAYGASLVEMGNCSLEACPGVGDGLKRNLDELRSNLSPAIEMGALAATESKVGEELRGWGRGAAKHFEKKAREVKEMLLAMARTAESVGARDERCAGQMNAVTERLKAIASLDDLTAIRVSIEESAAELKTSISRMVAEGKATLDQLRGQVAEYQAKLEEAEAIAARDALTGLSSRLHVEAQIEKRIAAGAVFCAALIDIDGFKRVNDEHGHLTGDGLLKQFASELRSACRATDVIGRWGGDEFILLFDCPLAEAKAQTERLRKWICGSYTVGGGHGDLKLHVDASIGLASYEAGDSMEKLIAEADRAMYAQKASARGDGAGPKRPTA
jgi:diguanylate cyclase (GGDEF)-like protein